MQVRDARVARRGGASCAFAAGHRPCAECRRTDYDRFTAIWRELHDESGADVIDARLHDERIGPGARERRLHAVAYHRLPDGTFVLHEDAPKLVLGDALRSWSCAGYGRAEPRPSGTATLITPPSLVEVLRAGWYAGRAAAAAVPFLHPTADGVD